MAKSSKIVKLSATKSGKVYQSSKAFVQNARTQSYLRALRDTDTYRTTKG